MSDVMGLRKDFDNHMGIYKSLAAEDIGAVCLGEVADVVRDKWAPQTQSSTRCA
jgi:hypothetical protein